MNDLQLALENLKNGDYKFTLHARKRMSERNITNADIQNCGNNGKAIRQNDSKIKIVGRDLDGILLTIICIEYEGCLIITAY